jgi:hypothetical protein
MNEYHVQSTMSVFKGHRPPSTKFCVAGQCSTLAEQYGRPRVRQVVCECADVRWVGRLASSVLRKRFERGVDHEAGTCAARMRDYLS